MNGKFSYTLNFNIISYELNTSLAKNVISVKSCKIQKSCLLHIYNMQ